MHRGLGLELYVQIFALASQFVDEYQCRSSVLGSTLLKEGHEAGLLYGYRMWSRNYIDKMWYKHQVTWIGA